MNILQSLVRMLFLVYAEEEADSKSMLTPTRSQTLPDLSNGLKTAYFIYDIPYRNMGKRRIEGEGFRIRDVSHDSKMGWCR